MAVLCGGDGSACSPYQKCAVVPISPNIGLECPAHFAQSEPTVDYLVEETRFYHPQVLARPVGQVPVNLRSWDMVWEGAVRICIGKRYVGKAGRLQRARD